MAPGVGSVGSSTGAGPGAGPITDRDLLLRRAAQRSETANPRVTSRSSFSFGSHYDPANVSFGALLVCNDDVVQPGPGYHDHPHADAEIVTWVVSGSLVHQDSRGHRGVIHPGVAQRMSAGSGIVHAERNDAYRLDPTQPVEPVRFVQMWVRPDEPGGDPRYAQREFDRAELDRDWLPVVSGSGEALVDLRSAGSTLWATVLAPEVSRRLPAGDRTHLYVVRGAVELEGAGELAAGDSVRATGQAGLRVTGRAEAELLVWRLAP